MLIALASLLASPSLAGPVRLSDANGLLTIEGDLLSRDGEVFRIETEYGPVSLDAGALLCSGAGCPDPADMIVRATVGGPADLMHRLFPALLEVFADTRDMDALRIFHDDQHVTWELTARKTNRLVAVFDVRTLQAGDAQAGLNSGDLTLAFSLLENASETRSDVVALDGLVPAVAPDNPRVMVTLAQLRVLMNDAGATWEKLGGTADVVSVHLPSEYPIEPPRLGLKGLPANAVRHATFEGLADTVAQDPAALGIVPYSALGNATPLVVSGACGLATPATRDTIRAEDYPVTRPIFLHRMGADHPKLVREFIAFARSAAVQPVIRAAGFVDQAIGRISFERQGGRIANAVLLAGDDPNAIAEVRDMIGTLLGGERLTLTFRFRDGSSDLDPQSVSNVQRLADAISDGTFDGQQVLFVGFSDGVGDKNVNQRLSERRARAVRSAVASRIDNSEMDLNVAAFGELMPMACDSAPWGGQVNRRVEVWVKPLDVTR
ncbi:MAG: phosphate ABC transporter substrate-binding/OmpA family protein [Pseudomonadota bacterium]